MDMRRAGIGWIVALLAMVLGSAFVNADPSERALVADAFATGSANMALDDVEGTQGSAGIEDAGDDREGVWFGTLPVQSASMACEKAELEAVLVLSSESVETGATVMLDASASGGSAGIILFEWDLDGDGTYDAFTYEPTYETAYEQDGTESLCVRVTDSRGNAMTSATAWLTVSNRFPIASFDMTASEIADTESISFDENASDPDGKILSWIWNFGDGTSSAERTPEHAYSKAGTYVVTLTITDDDGAIAMAERHVAVTNTLPAADFMVSSSWSIGGQTIRFIDESVDPSPSGAIVHVAWDFGDGTFAAGGPSPDGAYEHTYAFPGSYIVILYIIDDQGGLSRAQAQILVDG